MSRESFEVAYREIGLRLRVQGITDGNADRASHVLALELPPGMRDTYANRVEYGKVALSTFHHRARGRCSKEIKDRD